MPRRLIAVVACALLLAACEGTVTEENYAKVQVGMPMEQVERILGAGTEEASGGFGFSSSGLPTGSRESSTKTWSWKDGQKQIIVEAKDGKVVGVRKLGF